MHWYIQNEEDTLLTRTLCSSKVLKWSVLFLLFFLFFSQTHHRHYCQGKVGKVLNSILNIEVADNSLVAETASVQGANITVKDST